MKTILRKCGLFAVLLVTAVLVTTCMNSLDFSGLKPPEVPTAAPGKAIVGLNLGGSVSRTILPDTSGINPATAFDMFVVTIEDSSGNFAEDDQNNEADGAEYDYADLMAATWELDIGEDYEFTILAYLDYTDGQSGEVAAAMWTDIIEITQGTGAQQIAVALEAFDPATSTDEGTFAWSFTYNGGSDWSAFSAGSALLTLYDDIALTSTVAGFVGIDITAAATSEDDIDAGYYYAVVRLDIPNYQSVSVVEALHVYQALTSTWTEDFSALALNEHTVTYTYIDPASSTSDDDQTYTHGTRIDFAADGMDATTLDALHSGYLFQGWYTVAGTQFETNGASWDVDNLFADNTRVLRTMDLHARWIYATRQAELLSITLETIDDVGSDFILGQIGSESISQADYLSDVAPNNAITFTINTTAIESAYPSFTPATDIVWMYQGATIETGPEWIMEYDDATDGHWSIEMANITTHTVTVFITLNTVTYSATIAITVNP